MTTNPILTPTLLPTPAAPALIFPKRPAGSDPASTPYAIAVENLRRFTRPITRRTA